MLDKIKIVEPVTLRELRTLSGMNLRDFAVYVGIPYSSYVAYEERRIKLPFARVKSICARTGIEITMLDA